MATIIMPAQSALREWFDYDPSVGILRWRKRGTNRIQIGQRAGRLGTDGYYGVGFQGSQYKAHRIIWKFVTGTEPSEDVDHINGDRIDNRWINLRLATKSQNRRNRLRKFRPKYVGIRPKSGKFTAYLILGTFDTHKEADEACRRAFKLFHGDADS